MKKSLFVTMLAATFLGGQVFAANVKTSIEGDPASQEAGVVVGVLEYTKAATGGNLLLRESESGTDLSDWLVVGGGTMTDGNTAAAYQNKVTMEGGMVGSIYGGAGWDGEAYNNTVILTGGAVLGEIDGGLSSCDSFIEDAHDNVVIIAGNAQVFACYGGYSTSGKAYNNKVHLVGGGIEAQIADAEGNVSTYTGGQPDMYVGMIAAGDSWFGEVENNSIDIYGYGLKGSCISGMDQLNFHLADELADPGCFALQVGWNVSLEALGSDGIAVYGDAVTNWSAFDGKTITLITENQDTQAIISGLMLPVEDLQIRNAAGDILATGTLALSENQKQLQMTVHYSGVPEPSTGTLSLLALAALAARRRK